MNLRGAERRGFSLSWLVLVLAVLTALPALIVTPLIFVPILCVFLAGIGLARRRFTPAIATVVVATATILLSPLGGSMFDPRSYAAETYDVPPEMQGELAELMESGESADPSLGERIEGGSLVVSVYRFPVASMYVMSGLVGLAYLSVVVGAVVGIRRVRDDPPGGT